jgi:bifunctional DNA-binding transcriptional regulator/antitoxin component of YhaV-PrlF toxin-antitoxin module
MFITISVIIHVITYNVCGKKMPHEEIRKIIRVGNSYAITIPRAWLRYFKLSDKDELLVISDGTVIIKPPQKKQELEKQ